jgi:PAS domain S-box-containing protein
MLENPTQEVHLRTRAYPTLPLVGALGLAVAIGIAYFLAARLSLALLAKPDGVAVFWPAAGVSSGVLIVLGRAARLPVASGVIVATIIANLMGDRSVWDAAASALWDTGEALFAAWLIERYFGLGFTLGRLRNVLGLLAAALVATTASGIGGTVAFRLFHSPTAPIWTTWQHWFASDATGIIIVAPLVIGLAKALREPPPRGEIIEGVAALVALAATIVFVILLPFEPWQAVRPAVLLFPVLLWLAARCQPVFAAAGAFIVSFTIVWTTTFGIGQLVNHTFPIGIGDPTVPIGSRILAAQIAIAACTLSANVLAALFAERRQAEERLLEALTAGGMMAFECDLSRGLAQRSGNAAQILGLGPQETLTAAQFLARIHPDDRARFEAHHHRAGVDSPATATFRFVRPDGHEVWLEQTSRAEFDMTGHLLRVKGLTRDITRRKQSEQRQDLLSAELDHRVKNVLACVGAVVRHTRRRSGTPDEFVKAIDDRVQSIAAAHALLSQNRWSGVGVTDLIRHQLAPYTADANTTISGPDVTLTSAQTQAVAMVIHELATNAAKHGALSEADGKVSVSWDCTGADQAAILTMTWRELGGAPVTAPVQTGYGLSLIRDLVPHELGGTVDLTFPPGGARCKIEIPLGRLG